MVRCEVFKSSLYPILEEEPEEKKPTRAPYRGRKSIFLERPVAAKKLLDISHQEMEEIYEMESYDSGIHLEADGEFQMEESNNNYSEIHLEADGEFQIEESNNNYLEIHLEADGEFQMKESNNNYSEIHLEEDGEFQMKESNNNYSGIHLEVNSKFQMEESNNNYSGIHLEVDGKFQMEKSNNNSNLPEQQTAEVIVYHSDPITNKVENIFKDISNFSLEPENETRYLYCGDYEYPHQTNFVNFNAVLSTDTYCADLPFLGTLQFFYNLGWEYFHAVNAANNYCYSQSFNFDVHSNYIPEVKKRNYNNFGHNSGYRKDFINWKKLGRGKKRC